MEVVYPVLEMFVLARMFEVKTQVDWIVRDFWLGYWNFVGRWLLERGHVRGCLVVPYTIRIVVENAKKGAVA